MSVWTEFTGSRLDRRRPSQRYTVPLLLPPARHLGYGFLPVSRVDLPRIATARPRQEAARILRDEVCNRSDDGNPPLELSGRIEQILASRDWLPPMSRQAEPAFSLR